LLKIYFPFAGSHNFFRTSFALIISLTSVIKKRHRGGLKNNYVVVELLKLGQNIYWCADACVSLLPSPVFHY